MHVQITATNVLTKMVTLAVNYVKTDITFYNLHHNAKIALKTV
jgi:hypothetical protein